MQSKGHIQDIVSLWALLIVGVILLKECEFAASLVNEKDDHQWALSKSVGKTHVNSAG